MFAFFCVKVEENGEYSVHEGSLFKLPAELKDLFRLEKYSSISKTGWTKTEFGYWAFVFRDKFGNKFVFPGLIVSDAEKPTKRFHGHSWSVSTKQVETYVQEHLESVKDAQTKSEEELTALVHDLRHLSSSIYHSALEAKEALRTNRRSDLYESIETVVATQTMLKVRIDYLDFVNDIDRFEDSDRIPVYGRVDKVVRCFRASAASKGMSINLTGSSYRQAEGPNILDIVPYSLIDNAIKYSPQNEDIDVHIEDNGANTKVTISSVGPKIECSEKDRIFVRGFRGKNAIDFRHTGTGLGLAVAKEIIDIFSGEIFVSSEPIDHKNEFDRVSFSFLVPTPNDGVMRRRRLG